MEEVICNVCNNQGAIPKCVSCGCVSFTHDEIKKFKQEPNITVPTWYVINRWDETKVVYDDRMGRTKTLDLLSTFLRAGELPAFSAMILLPKDSGKRIAMYTFIQQLIERGNSVAPVVDITTLNILLNRNRYEDQQVLLRLFSSDMAIIYSTDFVTRKNSAKIFDGVCKTRALSGKPTLFLGDNTFKDLSEWGTESSISKNMLKNDKLSHPYIFDGVAERVLYEN